MPTPAEPTPVAPFSDHTFVRPHGRPGLLVAVDGPSGVGKTTVTGLVVAQLAEWQIPALATSQPSDSAMGKLARASTHELQGLALTFLMAADRHHHQTEVIVPALADGTIVVCDRYVPTALVLDRLDGAEPDFIMTIYQHMVRPDVAVLLAGDPGICRERAAARGSYSRFHEGGTAAGVTEAAMYDQAAALLSTAGYPVTMVDTMGRSAAQVARDVLDLIGWLTPLPMAGEQVPS